MFVRWFGGFAGVLGVAVGGLIVSAETSQAQDAAGFPTSVGIPVDPPKPLPPQPASRLAKAVASALGATTKLLASDATSAATDMDYAAAQAFYTERGAEPLWVSRSGLTERAKAAIAEMQRASDWGLNPADFPVTAVAASTDVTPEALASAELTMTGAALKYARHARGGRIASPETQLSGYIDRRPNLIEPAAVLDKLVAGDQVDQVLREFHPKHRQFDLLRQAYLKARGSTESIADKQMPVTGPVLLPGKWHADVAILRRRLGVAKPDQSDAEWMEPALVDAVRAFQAGVGLKADAMIGDRTRRALNEALDSKGNVDQLLANMEAWRWMPDDLGATRVEVNVPEQLVRFYRDGRLVFTERVIVGKMETATPLFSDEMETIVFQPTWGVPNSIKIKDLLPDLQAGNGLRDGLRMKLGSRDIDPWDVDWSKADITKYLVYQPSGDDNALGEVKFLFPNSHAVYLHDTPNKKLFGASVRMFSHGCVRVRNPMKFAEVLLDADRGMTAKEVRKIANDGPEDNKVRLGAKIPIHLTYFTVTIDDSGKPVTAPDLYGHEKRVTLALQGQFGKIKKLDPPVIEPGKPGNRDEIARALRANAPRIAQGAPPSGDTGVRVNGRYSPPAALGYYSPPPQPWKFFTPSPQPASRSRGNTPNDIMMRTLSGN
ncbi:MAG: L,D-transpeptidase family protein [Hyphomicrobiaceae bacterium]|nr:L,D-transpeptidase family protein [Hyphomicrobiaceae bacterium]